MTTDARDAGDPFEPLLDFVETLRRVEREERQAGRSIPRVETKALVAESFWNAMGVLSRHAEGALATEEDKARSQSIVAPYFLRSRPWNRSMTKPHGYAGDFAMVELMYDLEEGAGADPTQPAMGNLLDHLFATVHSVRSVWHRRRWLSDLIARECASRGGRLSILDIAAGGARYLRDALDRIDDSSRVEAVLLDQDPCARHFCARRFEGLRRIEAITCRIRDLEAAVEGRSFDLVISSGLFDYLDDAQAASLLKAALRSLGPGGTVAITNFHPADPSRYVKSWLVDWDLVWRTPDQVRSLFPEEFHVAASLDRANALVCASASRT